MPKRYASDLEPDRFLRLLHSAYQPIDRSMADSDHGGGMKKEKAVLVDAQNVVRQCEDLAKLSPEFLRQWHAFEEWMKDAREAQAKRGDA